MDDSETFDRIKENITEFPVASRKMFWGLGVFSGDVMFALIHSGVAYLKSTTEVAIAYSEDSAQFVPPFRMTTTMPYWSVPEEILGDRARFAQWARESLKYAWETKKRK